MKQTFLATLLFLFFCLYSILAVSQCNTSILTKRSYYKATSEKDKSLGIQITAEMDYKFIEALSKEVSEMVGYIKSTLRENQKPDITKYIKSVNDYKKSLISKKQIKETNKLDNLLYCFYTFLSDKYKKLQSALIKKDKNELVKETQNVCNEIVSEGGTKLADIEKEIKYLYNKYRVDN